MFDKWLKLPAHYYLKITALVILTVGVCLHNTLMSIGTIWIGANWLIEAKYPFYWKKFKSTPAIWFLIALLILSFISLAWSSDTAYGLRDIAKKMPFFVIPFILGLSEPVEQKVRNFLFWIFLFVLALTSGINFYRFNYVLDAGQDIREMSYFISHVRFSILVVLGIAISIYFASKRPKLLIVLAPLIIWLLYYTFKSQIVNGYVLITLLALMTIVFGLLKLEKKALKYSGFAVLIALMLFSIWKANQVIQSFDVPSEVVVEDLPKKTVNGNSYMHDLNSQLRENGNLVWYYVQPEELELEWNKRASIAYDSIDNKNQPMFGTLIRYMTSRDIPKDSLGVSMLSDDEIKTIENGATSIRINDGLKAKLDDFMYQWFAYMNEGDPNGYSLLQRLEHLKIGWSIATDNILFGVGIGDVNDEFINEYERADTQLSPENQHRAHNQYLTYWISLGIIGLLIFLLFFTVPLFKVANKDYMFYAIFIVIAISLFFQDLLETQAGVCIFGLFYGLMAFTNYANPAIHPSPVHSDQ